MTTPSPGPHRPMLTDRQRTALDFIAQYSYRRGFPPSLREIGNKVGLASSSSAHKLLRGLVDLGYVHYQRGAPRAYALAQFPGAQAANGGDTVPLIVPVPLVRHVTPEQMITADGVEDVYPMSTRLLGGGELVAVRMSDASMAAAGIRSGDIVFVRRHKTVRHGDLLAAALGTTVMIRRLECHTGTPVLHPHAHVTGFAPVAAADTAILGKVTHVFRSL